LSGWYRAISRRNAFFISSDGASGATESIS
jgi:hypothetical protein